MTIHYLSSQKVILFTADIGKFDQQGEKTGWTYITIPASVAGQIKHGEKRSYRVRGTIDQVPVKAVALLPMGNGDFILPLNADLRRKLKKAKGATVAVSLQYDQEGYLLNEDLMQSLGDEPEAFAHFNTLTGSHQRYFSKWVESAKTLETRAKRIAMTVNAMLQKHSYSEMIRFSKSKTE